MFGKKYRKEDSNMNNMKIPILFRNNWNRIACIGNILTGFRRG